MYVYVDVVFMINVVMNSIILLLTAWVMRISYSIGRLLVAALAGAFYVLAGLFLHTSIVFDPFVKLIVSLFIVIMAFGRKPVRVLLLLVGIFFLVSFMLGGAVLGWLFFWESTDFMQLVGKIKAGFGKVTWTYLTGGVLFGTALTGILLRKAVKRLLCFKTIYKVRVHYGGKSVDFTGMMDTGNRLYTPVGRRPVVLVNQQALDNILEEPVRNYLQTTPPNLWLANLEQCDAPRWLARIQAIPCRAVSGNGLLLGFRPDSIEVINENNVAKSTNIVLGLYGGVLSNEGVYEALLHPEMIRT